MTEKDFENKLENIYKKYGDILKDLGEIDQNSIFLKYRNTEIKGNFDHCVDSTENAMDFFYEFKEELKERNND